MKIKQDPITKLWCRGDGAVLMPPSHRGGMHYRWTFGSKTPNGYRKVRFHGKYCLVHRIICRAFNGLPPDGKPEVDHINRIKEDNRPANLHWVDHKENQDNKNCVDQSIAKYGVRYCEDRKAYSKAYSKAYNKAYYEAHCEEAKAYHKAYYEAHREDKKAYGKAYRERRKHEAA